MDKFDKMLYLVKKLIARMEFCDFKDEIGHKVTMNKTFIDLKEFVENIEE